MHKMGYFNQDSCALPAADASITDDLHEDKPESLIFDFRSQDSCCEDVAGSECTEEEAHGDIAMLPPLPYYLRNVDSSVPVKLAHDARKRGSSFQNLRREARAKDFLRSPQMYQSMPSLCSSRSMHNRRMGSMMDFLPNKANLASRIKEFEALLADL